MLLGASLLCLGLAFIGAGLSDLWPQLLLFALGAVAVGALSFFLGATLERRPAGFGAGALGVLAVLAWTYGVYVAYATGWQGLDESDLGSDDLGHGHTYIWKSFLYSLFVVPLVAGLVCFGIARLGAFVASYRRGAGP